MLEKLLQAGYAANGLYNTTGVFSLSCGAIHLSSALYCTVLLWRLSVGVCELKTCRMTAFLCLCSNRQSVFFGVSDCISILFGFSITKGYLNWKKTDPYLFWNPITILFLKWVICPSLTISYRFFSSFGTQCLYTTINTLFLNVFNLDIKQIK